MKAFALCLFAAAASAQVCTDCPTSDGNGVAPLDVVELIDGFLIGALETESVDNLETCIADFTPFVVDMTTAVQDFEDGSFHAIADGIYQLGQFISQVGITMEDCVAVGPEDVEKLKMMGDAFLHPKQLIINAENNLIVNGVEILKDIRHAKKDMQNGMYDQAGQEFGTVAALVLWGAQNMAYEPFTQ